MGWLSGYQYRKKVTISGSSGAGQYYQVKLSIGSSSGGDFHLEGHCTDFPNDIRFTDDDGETLLDYWIEDPTQDPITVWVEVKDNLDNDVDIYCYYGKSGASSASDSEATFEFYDDFEFGSLVSWDYGDYGFGGNTNPVFVHDIDGDGQKEIILARLEHENKLVVLNHDGSHRFTFTGDDTDISFDYHAIAFADVNGDGKDEIIFGSDKVYAIDYNGNELWSYDPETYYYYSDYSGKNVRVIALDAADIDNDGDIETVALIHDSSSDHSSQNQVVDCIKKDGSGRKWRWGPTTANAVAHYLLLARLDQSSNYYHIIFTDASQLWCLKHDGTEQWHNTDAHDSDMHMAVNVNESSDNLEVLACGKDKFCAINLDGSMYWSYNTGHTQEFDVADVNNDGHYEIGVFNNYDDHLFIFSHDGNKLYDGYVSGIGWNGLINAVKVDGNWYFAIGDRLYNHNGCVGKCLKFIGTTKHFNYKHHIFGYSPDFDNDNAEELIGNSCIGEIEIAPWTAQTGCFDLVGESGNGIAKGVTNGANLVTHNMADIGVGKAIRAKIRADDDYSGTGIIFGYQDSSNFYHVRVDNGEDELQIYEWVSGSASKKGSASVTISTGTWYVLEAIWSGANSIEAKLYDVDGNELASASATMTGGFSSGKIGFRTYNRGSYDDFRVRKYADPEPTFSSANAEETGPMQKSSLDAGAAIDSTKLASSNTRPDAGLVTEMQSVGLSQFDAGDGVEVLSLASMFEIMDSGLIVEGESLIGEIVSIDAGYFTDLELLGVILSVLESGGFEESSLLETLLLKFASDSCISFDSMSLVSYCLGSDSVISEEARSFQSSFESLDSGFVIESRFIVGQVLSLEVSLASETRSLAGILSAVEHADGIDLAAVFSVLLGLDLGEPFESSYLPSLTYKSSSDSGILIDSELVHSLIKVAEKAHSATARQLAASSSSMDFGSVSDMKRLTSGLTGSDLSSLVDVSRLTVILSRPEIAVYIEDRPLISAAVLGRDRTVSESRSDIFNLLKKLETGSLVDSGWTQAGIVEKLVTDAGLLSESSERVETAKKVVLLAKAIKLWYFARRARLNNQILEFDEGDL